MRTRTNQYKGLKAGNQTTGLTRSFDLIIVASSISHRPSLGSQYWLRRIGGSYSLILQHQNLNNNNMKKQTTQSKGLKAGNQTTDLTRSFDLSAWNQVFTNYVNYLKGRA